MEQNYQPQQFAQASYNQGQQYAQTNYDQGQQYAQAQQPTQTSNYRQDLQYDKNMYNSPNAQYAGENQSAVASWFDYKSNTYLKGLLIGAGVTLLATNPTVQKAVVKGSVSLWNGIRGGVEEIKEKIEDIKAELAEK